MEQHNPSSSFNDKLDKILATDIEGERAYPTVQLINCPACGVGSYYAMDEEHCVNCGEPIQ